MNVNQQIEAFIIMVVPPMDFFVLPRMPALCLMMPLLCIYADLIGIPLRVTVSARTLAEDAVELKRRAGGEPWRVPRGELLQQWKEG